MLNCNLSYITTSLLAKQRFGLKCYEKNSINAFLQTYLTSLNCDDREYICLIDTEPCDTAKSHDCDLVIGNITFTNAEDTITFSYNSMGGVAPFTIVWTYDTEVLELVPDADVNSATLQLQWIHGRPLQAINNVSVTVTDAEGCQATQECQFISSSELVDDEYVFTESMTCEIVGGCEPTSTALISEQGNGYFIITFSEMLLTDVKVYNGSNVLIYSAFGISSPHVINLFGLLDSAETIVLTYHCPDGTTTDITTTIKCGNDIPSLQAVYSSGYDIPTGDITHKILLTWTTTPGAKYDIYIKNLMTNEITEMFDFVGSSITYESVCGGLSCAATVNNEFTGGSIEFYSLDTIEYGIRKTCPSGYKGNYITDTFTPSYDCYSIDTPVASTAYPTADGDLILDSLYINGVNVIGSPVTIGTYTVASPYGLIIVDLINYLNNNLPNNVLLFSLITVAPGQDLITCNIQNSELTPTTVINSIGFHLDVDVFNYSFALGANNYDINVDEPCQVAPPSICVVPEITVDNIKDVSFDVNITNITVGQTYDISIDNGATWVVVGTTNATTTISGLTPGTSYQVRVKANCSSIISNTENVTTEVYRVVGRYIYRDVATPNYHTSTVFHVVDSLGNIITAGFPIFDVTFTSAGHVPITMTITSGGFSPDYFGTGSYGMDFVAPIVITSNTRGYTMNGSFPYVTHEYENLTASPITVTQCRLINGQLYAGLIIPPGEKRTIFIISGGAGLTDNGPSINY